ncbi:hypothetical protein INS49_013486 [Diaporthe citri]|uniref:uncharacterized protein n=1 Tax=Diaporthe citri TaxID=83186 RepID=UPI001C811294|nr:uncharacterized protein INS49_013486 [Diaporthe citri]KAG6357609.1 hypothetical protein INS49_013486 [Diaporthe citri]
MQILLLGATGRTGLLVLKEALARNHTVTALVRSPQGLEASIPADHPSRPNLTTVAGSPLNAADVAAALAASPSPVDVVITTLNPRRASDSPFAAVHPADSPPRMMADSMAGVLAALKNSSSKKTAKVVALSALGAGSSAAHTHCLLRLLFRQSNMRFTYEDHDAVEEVLVRQQREAGAVPHVLVRPTRLVDGEEGGAAKVFGGNGTVGMMETISRGAVARFLVDAAERGEWDGKAPIIVG